VEVISTRDLTKLPDVADLQRLLQSMAVLDAILCPEWQFRYYSFNAGWAPGETMGSMRNGSGDDYFVLFSESGCFLKGFAHEAQMSPYRSDPPRTWPGVLDDVAPEFQECLKEPAFNIDQTTFCVWRLNKDATWKTGNIQFPDGLDPDGSENLLSPLDDNPETYRTWAEEYYGEEWDEAFDLTLADVRAIYEHQPLSDQLVAALNPELTVEGVSQEVRAIGYPIQD
jgi:hypothetical protein